MISQGFPIDQADMQPQGYSPENPVHTKGNITRDTPGWHNETLWSFDWFTDGEMAENMNHQVAKPGSEVMNIY